MAIKSVRGRPPVVAGHLDEIATARFHPLFGRLDKAASDALSLNFPFDHQNGDSPERSWPMDRDPAAEAAQSDDIAIERCDQRGFAALPE